MSTETGELLNEIKLRVYKWAVDFTDQLIVFSSKSILYIFSPELHVIYSYSLNSFIIPLTTTMGSFIVDREGYLHVKQDGEFVDIIKTY
jgi:hypothetical protein